MNSIKKSKHKQSKYFTLMLVPYSSQKTKTIRIPHNFIYFLLSIVILIGSAFLFSYIKVNSFKAEAEELKTIADNKQSDLEKTIEKNWELIQEKNLTNKDIKMQEQQFQQLIDGYRDDLKLYEEKASELEIKIEELDKSKNDLYDILSEKIGYDPGISFSLSSDYERSNFAFMSMPKAPESAVLQTTYSDLEQKLQNEIDDFNDLINEVAKHKPRLDAMPSGWPIKIAISITSYFGNRSNPFSGQGSESHLAVDLKASTGTPVYTTGGGTVSYSGLQAGYGYLVIVDHGFDIKTYYAHNSTLNVSVGQKVSRGDLIAYSGSTGRSTGPHVHYEVRVNNIPKDPLDFMK